ncbi:glycosyltransferase [Nostoc sp. CMAA1605]|uniref:glycosyltransferase n=1 Tax=Nostoc sp. CMAA1605 TaxID=2055159 RepID=UPI001F2B02FD|nr:glycosyltransferase [Nostoc sp. CMAA1605]
MVTPYSILKKIIPPPIRAFIRDLDSAYHALEERIDAQKQHINKLEQSYSNLEITHNNLKDCYQQLQSNYQELDVEYFDLVIKHFLDREDFAQEDFCNQLYTALNRNNIPQTDYSNKQSKRICILIPEDIRYFYPTIKLVADQITEIGIDVDIFCLCFGDQEELKLKHNFNTISYQTTCNHHYTKSGKLEFMAKAFIQLKMYDAYIGLNDLGLATAYFISKKIFHKPLIAYMLEIPSIQENFDNYVASLFDKVDAFVDVDPGRLKYRLTHASITNTRFSIRNLTRQKEILNIQPCEEFNQNPSLVLWYHGTISRFHGITEILDAYYKSKSIAELHLTGSFLLHEDNQQLLKRIEKENKPVLIHQPVPRDIILKRAAELASIAICFYPFRYSNSHDYLGRLYANPAKVFDYMALGIPTITSDNPNLVEYVQNEGWGICVPPEDSDAVAEAIDLLAQDEPRRLSMSRKAKELFESKYNLEQEVNPFINWLKSYLN